MPASQAPDETLSNDSELPEASTDTVWAVVCVWQGSDPIPVGVIRGDHQVDGGDWEEFLDGLWATCVGGDNADEAQAAVIEGMRHWERLGTSLQQTLLSG